MLTGELQESMQTVAEAHEELQVKSELEIKNERRARKQLKQLADDHKQVLQAQQVKIEKAAEREAELRQALSERLTHEAAIEEQIKQLKTKVDECEHLIIEQAIELKDRTETQRQTREQLRDATVEGNNAREKVSSPRCMRV